MFSEFLTIITRSLKLDRNLYKENKNFVVPSYTFVKENINVEEIDYYHSNVIARASKTMNECKISRENFKKTGTEN